MRLAIKRDTATVYISVLALLVLVMKCVCLLTWGRTGGSETALVVCSLVYYAVLAGLCVYSGKMKKAWIVLAVFFGLEVFMLFITVVAHGFTVRNPLVSFASLVITTSHYSLISVLRGIFKPFNDWVYFGCVFAMDAVFMAAHFGAHRFFGRKQFSAKKPARKK